MDSYSFLVSVCLAVGLSAACGFRVFIPPLAYGIFYKAGFVGLSDPWLWIGNDWIITLLAIAALFEVCFCHSASFFSNFGSLAGCDRNLNTSR